MIHGAHWVQGILAFLWVVLAVLGLGRPKVLFWICVASVSLLNFSFFEATGMSFTGELLPLVAIPDVLFATLFLLSCVRLALILGKDASLPKIPLILFSFFFTAVVASYFSTIPDRQMLLGGGDFSILLYGMMIFFLGTSFVRTEEDMRAFSNAWMISAAATLVVSGIDMRDMFDPSLIGKQLGATTGLFGLSDLISPEKFKHAFLSPWSGRIAGPFRANGQLATYALTTFFVALASFHGPRASKKKKTVTWIFSWLLVLCVILSMSLRDLPSLAFGILLYLGFAFSRSRKLGLTSIAMISLIAAFLFFVATVNPPIVKFWANCIGFHYENIALGSSPVKTWFLGDIRRAIHDRPLFGIGFGRFIQSDYHDLPRAFRIHNTPLQFLTETGIFGFSVYCVIMGYFFWLALQNLLISRKTEWKDFFFVLFLGVLALPATYLYNRHMNERTFWLLLVLIYSGNRMLKKIPAAELKSETIVTDEEQAAFAEAVK